MRCNGIASQLLSLVHMWFICICAYVVHRVGRMYQDSGFWMKYGHGQLFLCGEKTMEALQINIKVSFNYARTLTSDPRTKYRRQTRPNQWIDID